jgi:branched-chain amino acid transport system permease protein
MSAPEQGAAVKPGVSVDDVDLAKAAPSPLDGAPSTDAAVPELPSHVLVVPAQAAALRERSDRRALAILPSTASKVGVLAALAIYVALPLMVSSDFWVTVLVTAGVTAIGAIGLNILTGYTGQVSLGHAFFIYIGVYTAAYLGTERSWELFGVHVFDGRFPLIGWLAASALFGAVVGAAIGPFALRLRGNYLVVATLALVFVGEHLWDNWESVTNGSNGVSTSQVPLSLGFVDFANMEVLGKEFSRLQGLFFLTWAIVGISLLLCRNLIRSRPGRAMQAVRDRDIAAEIIGVSPTRTKVVAFAVSSALAAVAGSLLAVSLQFVTPLGESALFTSIRYVAIIVVGGAGTLLGPVWGAIALGPVPELLRKYSNELPCWDVGGIHGCLVDQEGAGVAQRDGLVSVAVFNQILFGLLLILFLMFEPRGVAGLGRRVRSLLARRSRSG